MIKSVAIIGAGFSGALQAINLLRHDGPRALLIERRQEVSRGVAYSAAHPDHLLNVRAENMSAFPDDRSSYREWLAARGEKRAFTPRLLYGDYLTSLLIETAAGSGDRLQLIHGSAVDLHMHGAGLAVSLDDGRVIEADAAVLAMGNLPPHNPPGLDSTVLRPGRYVDDPWSLSTADGLADADTVLILGTGLTMVDIVLLLEAQGFRGRIIAMSRRGLFPHAHAEVAPEASLRSERPPLGVTALLRDVRMRADEVGWRAAVDELRPFSQGLWLASSLDERQRFLRHLRPWWDVHRHRLAPQVARKIDAVRNSGRLKIVAGHCLSFTDRDDGAGVAWRPRGSGETEMLTAQRIINCTGPSGDISRSSDPLLRSLLARGLVQPDDCHLGIDVDAQAAVIGADGASNPKLFALGSMTRGAFWEIAAVPDIRVQTWMLARRLSNAHWVEGEGL